MNRQPVVSGQFYPGRPDQLSAMVRGFLAAAVDREERPSILVMAPHAGYVYSGKVAGMTLGAARLPRSIVLLGPNHTGLGARLAVWEQGSWELPGGGLPVDEPLARELLDVVPGFISDTAAHLREHSLEVLCPFLREIDPAAGIVPVAVSESRLEPLLAAGRALGKALTAWQEPVAIVVSSDMSHYVSHDEARERDSLALEAALHLDPALLYETVRRHGISMCGVLPMTVGLAAALEMGASEVRVAAYATSGEVSGDFGQVVGYAGVIVS